jgi:hypothetical protein
MKIIYKYLSILIILAISGISVSCSGSSSPGKVSQKLSYAETVFEVQVPSALNANEGLLLEVLDEVTGIALNPERFKMTSTDGIMFSIHIPMAIGSVIRYRYVRDGQTNVIEKDSSGNQVHYRLFHVTNPTKIRDFITSWDQNPYSGTTGEISGYIYDNKSEAPLSEIMVFINGMRTFTSFDGFFKFEKVPLGEYHLTAMHPDGKYEVFQQNAVIAENSITPASFGMKSAKMVNVTFVVSAPEDTNPHAAIRILGNTQIFGNSFAEITGGASILALRAPVLKSRSDGKYELSLELPSGTDLRYKYSLGNGFINAEHDAGKKFITRQLIIPSKDVTISDTISTWYSKGTYPINFVVKVPENTPGQDFISIQFNPYVWLEPMVMWKTGTNQWTYSIYGPFEYLDNSQYRFCRNNQCGIADDEVTTGKDAPGYQLSLQDNQPLTINYTINQWTGLQPIQYAIQPVNFPAKSSFYIKGYQFNEKYDANWLPGMDAGFIDMGVSGANWLFFSPTWSFSKENKSTAGLKMGRDAYSADILKIKEKAKEAGLTFAIYPQINSVEPIDIYWSSSGLSYNWWQKWFDEYERFIINYVDFSEIYGIKTIIIGGKSVAPAFPNGRLPNGNFSNTPYDFKDRWGKLMEKIRSRYSGQIGFALPYSPKFDNFPEMISSADFIYLELGSAIAASNAPSVDDLATKLSSMFDGDIYKLYATFQKPVIIGLNYYSYDGSASDCINSNSTCANLNNGSIDVDEQADIYQAVLKTTVSRPWIYGLVSSGFNPAVSVQDGSSSVYGKPAMQVLAYYFNNLK